MRKIYTIQLLALLALTAAGCGDGTPAPLTAEEKAKFSEGTPPQEAGANRAGQPKDKALEAQD